eukprot:gene6465-6231_t
MGSDAKGPPMGALVCGPCLSFLDRLDSMVSSPVLASTMAPSSAQYPPSPRDVDRLSLDVSLLSAEAAADAVHTHMKSIRTCTASLRAVHGEAGRSRDPPTVTAGGSLEP